MSDPIEIHKPGQTPVNAPTCVKCGKIMLECQCDQGQASHGVDAEIPTETSQFDAIAALQEAQTPAMTAALAKLGLQVGRYKHLAQALLMQKQGGVMVGENYVNEALARAELIVVSKILEERLGIPPEDYVDRVTEQMDQMLMIKQMEYKVIITTDGVINDGNPQ